MFVRLPGILKEVTKKGTNERENRANAFCRSRVIKGQFMLSKDAWKTFSVTSSLHWLHLYISYNYG